MRFSIMNLNSQRMCKALFLWMISFSIPCFLYSQEITDIEKLLQDNDVETSEAYYEDIVATLQYLATNPLNINSASFDSLKILFFLSDAQIDNILEFRKKHGTFRHPNELLLITGIGTRVSPTSNHLSEWANIFPNPPVLFI